MIKRKRDFLFFQGMGLPLAQRVNFKDFLDPAECERRLDLRAGRLIVIGLKLNKIRLLHFFVKSFVKSESYLRNKKVIIWISDL